MCLTKHKKYQYLYLRNKIDLRIESLNHWLDTHGLGNDNAFYDNEKRLDFLSEWLDKINQKYNYA